MTPPELTAQQRQEALVKASRARTERARILGQLTTGETTVADVLDRAVAGGDPIARGMKVVQLLKALPGIGRVSADRMMRDYLGVAVPERKRLSGLGPRQRATLVEIGEAHDR